MATPLGYTPPAPVDDPAHAEVDDLIAALHESGLLRAAAGAVRTYPQLLRPVLDALDADTLRSVLVLTSALTHLDPDTSGRVTAGIRDARRAAAHAARRRPEGVLGIMRRLRDPATRRGISAALAAAAALGAALDQPAGEQSAGKHTT